MNGFTTRRSRNRLYGGSNQKKKKSPTLRIKLAEHVAVAIKALVTHETPPVGSRGEGFFFF